MKPPADLPSTLVVLGEAFARRAGIDPGDFWDYVYRRTPPPSEIRAAIVEALFPRVRPDDFLLPSPAENDTLNTMNATEIAPAQPGRPNLNTKHPFVAMLRKRGLTAAEVASELGRPATTVRSWYKDPRDPAFRPPPRDAVEKIRELYKVPLSAWARIRD